MVRRGSEVGVIVDGMAVGSSGQSLLVGEREVKLKENRGKPVMVSAMRSCLVTLY